MSYHEFDISIDFTHRIYFGEGFFTPDNRQLAALLNSDQVERKALVFAENLFAAELPQLSSQIKEYFETISNVSLVDIHFLAGGEDAKNSPALLKQILDRIHLAKIDRHSFVLAIGGGAFLDLIGFAAAIAHRGVRLIRFPTTTLSQDDSGVGVKNGVNFFNKKNWVGSFAVPYAVINDFDFLKLQSPQQLIDGLIEAVKVALVKDLTFFESIEANAKQLATGNYHSLPQIVEHSALLHAKHIAQSGDPFEMGSSRPLDFGHWAAHKLEQLTRFEVSHAHAVAIGLAIDITYSQLAGYLPAKTKARIINTLHTLNLPTWHPALLATKENSRDLQILDGLEEFREHLGGKLTILFLKDIACPIELNQVNIPLMQTAISSLIPTSTLP